MGKGLREVSAGCGSRLPPSWVRNDWSETAEVVAVGRWFQSLMVRGKKELDRTGWLVWSRCRRCDPLVPGSACWQKMVLERSFEFCGPVGNNQFKWYFTADRDLNCSLLKCAPGRVDIKITTDIYLFIHELVVLSTTIRSRRVRVLFFPDHPEAFSVSQGMSFLPWQLMHSGMRTILYWS